MNINIRFDNELLKRYSDRRDNLLFTIFISNGDINYPSEDWLDFGTIILGWWLYQSGKLLDGNEAVEFLFMDGPYKVKITQTDAVDTCRIDIEDWDISWSVSISELVNELIRATNYVCRYLKQAGIGEKERRSLTKGISSLHDKKKKL